MYAFVIGDHDTVTGFRLVGVKGVAVSSVEEARHALSRAVESADIAVIFVSEEFSTKMRDKIDKLRLSRISPLIVEIPGALGPSKATDIRDMVGEAVGVKI